MRISQKLHNLLAFFIVSLKKFVWKSKTILSFLLVHFLIAPVLLYRYLVSPLIGQNCRFSPSCSAYCIDALKAHGVVSGCGLAIRRLLKCHPWGGSGYDPVPSSLDRDI